MAAVVIDRGKYQKKLLDHYIDRGFENDDDLLFYVEEFLGFKYPRKTFCSHHTSPAQILCDLYFERTLYALVWANRLGGKTRLISILNHLDSVFKGPLEICNAGAAIEQANKGYQYYLESFRHPLLKPLILNSIQSKTELTNRSVTSIITGSFKGFNGPHPEKFRCDEVELMEFNVLEEGMNMSKSTGRIKAQDVLSSTRKFKGGTVQRLINEKDERGLTVMSYCIWDSVAKCRRECKDDKKYGNCPIYHLCGGKAHDAPADGWYPIADLVKKGMNLSKSTFEAQWENKRPSDAPLVYGEYFDRDKHVKTWDELYRIFKVDEFKKKMIPKDWIRIGGIDFGTNFAFTVLSLEARTRTLIQYFEYFWNIDRRIEDHVKIIHKLDDFRLIDEIFADPAAKQDRIEFKSRGVRTKKAIKDILLGIDEVKAVLQTNSVLERPKYYIVDGTSPETINEFENWSWKLLPDGTPNTEEPEEHSDHCMDAVRYAIYSYGRSGVASYSTAYVEGI